jgi:hypothetical protein
MGLLKTLDHRNDINIIKIEKCLTMHNSSVIKNLIKALYTNKNVQCNTAILSCLRQFSSELNSKQRMIEGSTLEISFSLFPSISNIFFSLAGVIPVIVKMMLRNINISMGCIITEILRNLLSAESKLHAANCFDQGVLYFTTIDMNLQKN